MSYLPILTKVRDIINPTIMLFRDNQSVTDSNRVNIQKSQKFVIFVNLITRQTASGNTTKDTIVHIKFYQFWDKVS